MKKSYEKVTIREICKTCQISIGSFYHHYQSKEDILNQGYHMFDHFIFTNIQTQHFDNIKEKILYLFSLELDAMNKYGYIFSTQLFKNQLSIDNPYILNTDRFFYKELYHCLEEYISIYHISIDTGTLLEELLGISRGNIYYWCLQKGSFNLVDITIKSIKHILLYYENNSD
jgi:hypothetical protein